MTLLAKMVSDLKSIISLRWSDRDDGIVDKFGVGIIDEVMFAENVEKSSEADGTADARESLLGEITGEIIVAATAADGADVFMFGEDKFENSAGVIVKAADDFHVGGDTVGEVDGLEVVESLVEFLDALGKGGGGNLEVV